MLTFRKGKPNIRISTQCLPIHVELVNMMEGLDEAEEDQYFTENPKPSSIVVVPKEEWQDLGMC